MKTVIGIIGPIGSGKDTAAEYLHKKLGIPFYQISSVLKDICHDRGIAPSRENLIELGTTLASQHGDSYLARYLLDRASDVSLIVGMRQLGQVDYLRQNSRLTLIAINASAPIRYKRAMLRGKLGEAKTLEAFKRLEIKENSPPRVQRLFECMRRADYTVVNNGQKIDLFRKLLAIMNQEKLLGKPAT
jgi:dephospho-CoA kinase